MNKIFIIARRELSNYFTTFSTYVIAAAFIALTGLIFTQFLALGVAHLRPVFMGLFFIFALFIPLITSRAIAGEKRAGTFELLITSPVHPAEIIVGKYLGTLVFSLLLILLTSYIPLMVLWFGAVSGTEYSWAMILPKIISLEPMIMLSGFLGLILTTGLFTATGVMASAVSPNQIVSGLTAALFNILLISPLLIPGIEILSLLHHYQLLIKGSINLQTIVYFLTFSLWFLMVANRFVKLESER